MAVKSIPFGCLQSLWSECDYELNSNLQRGEVVASFSIGQLWVPILYHECQVGGLGVHVHTCDNLLIVTRVRIYMIQFVHVYTSCVHAY